MSELTFSNPMIDSDKTYQKVCFKDLGLIDYQSAMGLPGTIVQ